MNRKPLLNLTIITFAAASFASATAIAQPAMYDSTDINSLMAGSPTGLEQAQRSTTYVPPETSAPPEIQYGESTEYHYGVDGNKQGPPGSCSDPNIQCGQPLPLDQ